MQLESCKIGITENLCSTVFSIFNPGKQLSRNIKKGGKLNRMKALIAMLAAVLL